MTERQLYNYVVTIRADRHRFDTNEKKWVSTDSATRIMRVDAFSPEDLVAEVYRNLGKGFELDNIRVSEEYIVDVTVAGKVQWVTRREIDPEVSDDEMKALTRGLPRFWFRGVR